MTSDIKKKYIRTFSGLIWKIVFDHDHLALGVEVRDESALQQDYFIIDVQNNCDRQLARIEQVSWWSSLLRISGDLLYILNYTDKKNPGPGELLAFNFAKSQMEKKTPDFTMIQNNEIELRGSSGGVELSFKNNLSDQSKLEIIYPEYVHSTHEKYPSFADFLNSIGIHQIIAIEYAEILDENVAILAYTKQFNRQLDRFLILLLNGEVLLHQQIDEKMKGIAPNSFVIFNNNLIFVENKKTINIYGW